MAETPVADAPAPSAAPEAPASPAEAFGAELTEFLKSDLAQTARGGTPAGPAADAPATPEGADAAPAPATDAPADAPAADATAGADAAAALANDGTAERPEWWSTLDAVQDKQALLQHPAIQGLVGTAADKRARALQRQQAAEKVSEDMPAFVQDWQAMEKEQRTAWLEQQSEYQESVQAAQADFGRAVALDFADLVELDVQAIAAAEGDRDKQRAAILASGVVRRAIEAEAARRERIAHEAGARGERSGFRAQGILPAATDNARPPVSTPTTFQEGREAFREALSGFLGS